jgi:hypothetical protein|tara:strand:+ start:187 stop:405 length:219 start_codon:yes stop_codon:yes gene_type:complete
MNKGNDDLAGDTTQKITRGVVKKLTEKNGQVVSKKKLYHFSVDAVFGHIENDMLVDVLLASNNFVTRVERVY